MGCARRMSRAVAPGRPAVDLAVPAPCRCGPAEGRCVLLSTRGEECIASEPTRDLARWADQFTRLLDNAGGCTKEELDVLLASWAKCGRGGRRRSPRSASQRFRTPWRGQTRLPAPLALDADATLSHRRPIAAAPLYQLPRRARRLRLLVGE